MMFGKSTLGPIGLDIGARSIKAVQVAFSAGRRPRASIHAAARIPRLQPGDAVTPPEVLRAFGVLRRQGFVGLKTICSVRAAHVLVGVLDLPARLGPGGGPPMDAIARQEFARVCKREPGTLEFAWWELPRPLTVSRVAQGTQALALGCAHADAESLLEAIEPSGLDVLAVDAPPSALARACVRLGGPATELTAILDLGYSAAQILVCSGGTLVYERTIPEASMRLLASGIGNELSLTAAEDDTVEYLLRSVGCLPGAQPADAEPDGSAEARDLIAAHADALATELKASFAYASRRFDVPVARVLITGAGADVPGLAHRVGERCGVATLPARADAVFSPPPGLDADLTGPGAMLALGLALHQAPDALLRAGPAADASAAPEPAGAPNAVVPAGGAS